MHQGLPPPLLSPPVPYGQRLPELVSTPPDEPLVEFPQDEGSPTLLTAQIKLTMAVSVA